LGAEPRYRAFISYSWQDKVWGRRIHSWLETYKIPKAEKNGAPLPKRLGRIFRDDADMPAASNIGDVVAVALAEAEAMIVVCSPRSARSKWVNSEVSHFRRLPGARKVYAVIIDGTPNSGDPDTECFPPACGPQRIRMIPTPCRSNRSDWTSAATVATGFARVSPPGFSILISTICGDAIVDAQSVDPVSASPPCRF